MIKEITFVKDITRIDLPLTEVKIWAKGECEALHNLIGFGFSHHLFVGHNGSVTLYCDEKECMLFDDILEKIMTDDFFNQICHTYFSLIEHIKSCSKEELHALLVEIWPILTIFQEVSQNPDLVSASDIRRLQRIRETTEKEVYDLFSLLEPVEEPDYYYFFKGEMYPEELDINTLRIAS